MQQTAMARIKYIYFKTFFVSGTLVRGDVMTQLTLRSFTNRSFLNQFFDMNYSKEPIRGNEAAPPRNALNWRINIRRKSHSSNKNVS